MKKPRLKMWTALLLSLVLGAAVSFAYTGSLTLAQELLVVREKEALRQAQVILEELLVQDSKNVEILCLLAEAHFYYGGFLEKSAGVFHWEKAQDYAEKAVSLDPKSADAHYWAASSMGRIGDAQGIVKSLFLVTPMLEHLETVLELDPEYAWAYFILSQMYQKLPAKPIGRGDRQLALVHAKKAWELEPTEPEFGLQYARLLVSQREQKQAQKILTDALASPFTEWTPPLREEAEAMLRELR